MKKYIKDISIFVMGIITATSIGVAAYTISAKEIGYSPKDSSWKVNNVADAIESLKTLKGGSNNYSLDEQVVGTWIDGKPLYQKTWDAGAIPSGAQNGFLMEFPLSNVDHIHAVNAFTDVSGIVPYVNPVSNSGAEIGYNITKTNLSIYTVSDRSGFGHFYITAQYTKTTDSATNS